MKILIKDGSQQILKLKSKVHLLESSRYLNLDVFFTGILFIRQFYSATAKVKWFIRCEDTYEATQFAFRLMLSKKMKSVKIFFMKAFQENMDSHIAVEIHDLKHISGL